MLMHLIFTFVSIPVNFPLSNLPTSSTCEDGSLCFEERGDSDDGGYAPDALADRTACFEFVVYSRFATVSKPAVCHILYVSIINVLMTVAAMLTTYEQDSALTISTRVLKYLERHQTG